MAVVELQRRGVPFLVASDSADRQRIYVLEPHDGVLWIGRGAACDISVDWDASTSRCHAELRRLPECWAIIDDGLSRNGTYVDGARICGRRRLRDGDVVRVGSCELTFRPAGGSADGTLPAESLAAAPALTPMQRRVLTALCRPLHAAEGPTSPASNAEIAAELVLSIATVKTHIRALFAAFGVEDLPHNRKRMRLAELARRAGLAGERRT